MGGLEEAPSPYATKHPRLAEGMAPAGDLGRLLEAVGWEGPPLSKQAICRLSCRLWAQQTSGASACLRPWERGLDATRSALPRQFAIGRAMFGRLPPIQQVRAPDGSLVTDPADINRVLWD